MNEITDSLVSELRQGATCDWQILIGATNTPGSNPPVVDTPWVFGVGATATFTLTDYADAKQAASWSTADYLSLSNTLGVIFAVPASVTAALACGRYATMLSITFGVGGTFAQGTVKLLPGTLDILSASGV